MLYFAVQGLPMDVVIATFNRLQIKQTWLCGERGEAHTAYGPFFLLSFKLYSCDQERAGKTLHEESLSFFFQKS